MALTDQQLADAIRSELADAVRLRLVAETMVTKYTSNAPDAIADEAVIRVSGYLLDSPPAPSGAGHAAVLRNSGAEGLLSPWKKRRGGIVKHG